MLEFYSDLHLRLYLTPAPKHIDQTYKNATRRWSEAEYIEINSEPVNIYKLKHRTCLEELFMILLQTNEKKDSGSLFYQTYKTNPQWRNRH